ncbi:MAG: RNA-guided pseudouridylation complex pseudouridine synthase subunit Cbf5 [Nitrososphaerota archaeon]|nr:RNA-guided pseudouridylation complex pseudouridine synthase subunit Cbf5 [Nitrososphaerota archaeon]MDG6966711.1 RNA-guided pseudouridylation complex pseudouridine synthase subunit Cbf5 [Nitrososphaerota archaeon]MDG6979228.1 RNA-guided pseudouridylation complex pseudouridine synthase subunit Cbf5 [Nitrososphaerota archaeon]MDG7022398.1 RNA-guided pseudouridylation complex pseudouridine synthase subunit Cbf5 [Nitrososphaerota archaeon]
MVAISEEPTDPAHGWRPAERPVAELLKYGLIPLDKTTGPTSHEEVSWVRRLTGADKAGHSGTLDPGVSGMLPIGLGRATKALGLLLLFPKEYVGVMRIHSSVPREQVDRVIAEFTDEIYQRPPQRSSVKRETRTRRIYELEVLEQKGNLFLLRCVCQAGTYIRKLFYDMGEVLAVGATMVELRRTKVGPLDEAKGIVTLHELDIALQKWKDSGDESELRRVVWPIESCLDGIKKVVVKDSAVDAVCHGAMLAIPGVISLSKGIAKGETVVLLTAKGELIGIAEASMTTEEVQAQPKGIAFPVRRVIMDQGSYPKMWKKQDRAEAERAEGAA